ncbi:jg18017 [Pararge aegeria aegeria]|uniref:Jg18017 protein n=1 Tax=Pararge aegeria aegeria TaxID=348720 RepID=A0A8S4RNP8_9NEOP|nr:jg18017 [Pararge aegeria aegeria]
MSGGNSKNKARSKRHEGWEEAGGEFYQELYPGGEQELFENLQRADAAKLATLLPSKQARNMYGDTKPFVCEADSRLIRFLIVVNLLPYHTWITIQKAAKARTYAVVI